MKKRFLLIPMLAAVMLATSCSKDDNNVDNKEVQNPTEVKKTNPITITAKKKSSVSKVALGDKNAEGAKYEEVFSDGDVLSLFLDDAAEPFTTLNISDGVGKTSATFTGGEMPAEANEQTITAKILPKQTPSGLQACSSLSEAVSTYASLKGTFTYDNTQESFSVNLDDEVSYFVIETNIESVDINDNPVTSRVFAFNTNQTISSTALGLTDKELIAGGNVYVKSKDFVTSITLSDVSATIKIGNTKNLSVLSVLPEGAEKTVSWSSSNEAVATVSASGEVTSVAVGEATITATATDGSGTTQTCKVRVNNVPDGYVDLGINDGDGKQVYWAQTNLEDTYTWANAQTAAANNNAELPKSADFQALRNNCYWLWDNTQGHKGYYVFKIHADADKGKITNLSSEYLPSDSYSIDNDTYIFLPAVFKSGDVGIYWSSTPLMTDFTYCLDFDPGFVNPELNFYDKDPYSVRLVRRSN